jgi:nucleoside-diphosphate-sugar epimerase
MDKKILITGATGFVGYWMRRTPWPVNRDCIYLNRADYGLKLWQEWNFDCIVHLAPTLPDKVIECAKRCNARILFASSGAVYARELNDYGRMKKQSEDMLLASGLDVRIARMFTFCGARLKWHNFAIGQFIRDAVAGGPIRILGDGRTVRSYMYGSDLGEWLWKILLDGQPGAIYDVGSAYPVTIEELAKEVAHNCGLSDRKIIIENTMGGERQKVYIPQTIKALTELNATVKVYFQDAIRRSVEDYKNEN